MSTGYTREQIRQLEILVRQNIPPPQSPDQVDGAPVAANVAVSGSDKGALIRFGFEHGEVHGFFLNCAVALKLVFDLYEAAQEQNWWPLEDQPRGCERDSRCPTEDEIWEATKVLSQRTDSAPKGALVSFGTGRTVSQFFMPQSAVREVLAGLRTVAERLGWWDEMQLIAAGPQ